MSPKVVMTDTVFPDLSIEREELKEKIGAELILCQSSERSSITKEAIDADALLVVYAKITSDIIQRLEKCRVICRMGIGVDNVDIRAATKKGIIVCNVPDYCWDEVSDHTLALALALLRKVMLLDRNVKNGEWSRAGVGPIHALRGMTWGLIGLGNIGRMVAQKAKVFGFHTIAYDPFVAVDVAKKEEVELVSLDRLLEASDVVSVHSPLTKETWHLIDEAALKKMKETAVLINTARGGLVDNQALARALERGWIQGAGLDVLEEEPPSPDNPLLRLSNMIITPHAAFYSEEAQITLRRNAAREIVRVLSNERPKNAVNKEVIKD